MMGDREKCIQAEMDEYMSKPLQQNLLIQTILKCATLGCDLLEKNRERELAALKSEKAPEKGELSSILRPGMENRAITSREPISVAGARVDSPPLVAGDPEDVLSNARRTRPDMRSLTG
jgi:osomolarity two-component system, sensor histidine kinase NIK1